VVDQSEIMIENAFSHMTLATGDWSAVKSNNLLESLFGPGAAFEREFKDGVFTKPGSKFVRPFTTQVDGETVSGYIVKMPERFVVPGATKAFYTA